MSAYMCNDLTFSLLVNAARIARYPGQELSLGDLVPVSSMEAYKQNKLERELAEEALFKVLRDENVRSLEFRYPRDTHFAEQTMPGTYNAKIEPSPTAHVSRAYPVTLTGALKVIDCYEYQSSEHPGWETSRAKRYCDQLRRHLIQSLPGYEDAPWGLSPLDLDAIGQTPALRVVR